MLYTLEDLQVATDGFSESCIISQLGEDIVYRGRLSSGCSVAIKRFRHPTLPNAQFMEEARTVELLGTDGQSKLFGCCCENGEQLLVAGFMPRGTIAEQLSRCVFSVLFLTFLCSRYLE
ncbi:hypothetical protein BRADI_5g03242v3 [Brachypodium distachyon]|uniref:Serine-threonine/tyrosine-protein kinase catalytic domain-containing protein n=1 Tax=Brachypodium distachyon TaxID=15368 RepID=A0A2K2CF80_BRADI|nr:hypothetical protein BRADI_5g03242v3 [Brachypodium distachyon]